METFVVFCSDFSSGLVAKSVRSTCNPINII